MVGAKGADYRILKLKDALTNNTYTFNIYCSNENLTISQNQSGEGIIITAPVYTTLSSITISEWVDATIQFSEIYSSTSTFLSNEFVTVSSSSNNWTFTIRQPKNTAYKYSLTDNYGKTYSFAHTYGTTIITDAVQGEIGTLVDSDYNLWYYAINTVQFYFNVVDYTANISVEELIFSDNLFKFNSTLNGDNKVEIPTLNTSNKYYTAQTPTNDRTIGIINLKLPTDISDAPDFEGGVYKFVITLTNRNDNSTQKYNIIISTLTPTINLYDKNNENKNSLFTSNSIFSGQLRIEYKDFFNYLSKTDKIFFPSYEITYKFEDNEENNLSAGTFVEDIGTYTINIYINLNGKHLLESKTFTISDSERDFYQVVYYDETTGTYKPATETGSNYTYNNTVYTSHYIVNSAHQINVNTEQDITWEKVDDEDLKNGTTTVFYKISNYGSTNKNINYFEKFIAITTVPKTSSIINSFTYFNSNGIETAFTNTSSTIIATVNDVDLDSLTIRWNSYYLIESNKVNIEIKYGTNADSEYNTSNITQSGTKSSLDLNLSGSYTITFRDMAGNVNIFTHPTFGYQSQSFNLTFIKDVVYTVNGSSAIDNAIYNDEVIIAIPEYSKEYYDRGYQPTIHAKKNGQDYSISIKDGVYTFTEPGFYEIYFSAKINGQDVRESGSTFTIINKNETRWAFEYSEFKDYEIVSIQKDGKAFSLENSTKSVLISLYDEKTGAGRYKITIKTNGEIEDQAFSFEFWINDAEIPIEISIPEGSSTTDNILVTYNAYNITQEIVKLLFLVNQILLLMKQQQPQQVRQ